jgi:hypothetical protein
MVLIRELLTRLDEHGFQYVIVGGMAAVLHGSSVVTEDLDVCAPMTQKNLSRLLAALADLHPRHRMPAKRPSLSPDPSTLRGFHNLYLSTDAGQLDILDSVDDVGDYATVRRKCITVKLFDRPVRLLNIDALIKAKAFLKRPKDLRVIADLEKVKKQLRRIKPR